MLPDPDARTAGPGEDSGSQKVAATNLLPIVQETSLPIVTSREWVSGVVEIRLEDTDSSKQRRQLEAVRLAPPGVTVELHVGACAPQVDAITRLRDHGGHVWLVVKGQPVAVRLWMRALREGPGVLW